MMERKYYPINEEAARTAKHMMSFDSYKEGSKTAEYRRMVDEVYDLAEEIAKERPSEEERAYSLAERYARKLALNMNKDSEIGTRCPSVMISGPANFPVRKKEKQIAAWEKNHEEYKQIQGLVKKLESIRYGKEAIKSNDENAIEKLQEKLDKLKELQETMKAVNKCIRLKDTEKGNKQLEEMGYTAGQIEELRKPDFCGRVGYPDYALQNNNQNIHRIEGRIKNLQAIKDAGSKEIENENYKIVENTEMMRIQILFDGKPEESIRNVLKGNGFRWAPSQGAWQRQLNTNGKYALERVVKELDEIYKAG